MRYLVLLINLKELDNLNGIISWQLGTMNYCAGRKLVNLLLVSTRLPLEHSVFVVEADIETKTY